MFRLSCPEHGLLSLRCRHEELALPLMGKALMVSGFLQACIGLGMILHG